MMGIDTKGVIKQEITIIDMKKSIEKFFNTEVTVHSYFHNDMFVFDFSYFNGETNEMENRNLNLFFNNSDYDDEVGSYYAAISLHYWGSSIKIINTLISHYGGYILNKDDTDDWEYLEATSQPGNQSLNDQLEQQLYKEIDFHDSCSVQEKLSFVKLIIKNKETLKTILETI